MSISNSKKSVTIEVNIWFKKPGRIAIASNKDGFISSVSNDPKSKRFHPNLYKKLEKVLQGQKPLPRVLLHDEIVAILTENNNKPMSASRIAFLVNERGFYKKKERAKTPDVKEFQIKLRVKNYPKLFVKQGEYIHLRNY